MSDAALAHTVCLRLQRPAFELSVDLELPGHGICALFGPSGSGKTTLLRCVAGLERAGRGLVRIAGETWQDDATGTFQPTWRRPLGYVFQEASLLEHLDVEGNLRFGLRRSRASDGERALQQAIELLGIDPLRRRRPAELSGGERQRVAIARALATSPRLLLLDEPLASLDPKRRQEILPWLERLRDETRTPMLYVTHAVDELARLADHVVVLEQGRVKVDGPTARVFADAGGSVQAAEDEAEALLFGTVTERDAHWQLCLVEFPGGALWLRDAGHPLGHAVRVQVLARDVSLTLEQSRHTSIQNHLRCVIERLAPDAHPSQLLVHARVGPTVLLARITRRAAHELELREGLSAWAQVKSAALTG